MLVLSRNVRETIHVGPDVVFTILAVKGGKISVGIEAGDKVVLRGELAATMPDFKEALAGRVSPNRGRAEASSRGS